MMLRRKWRQVAHQLAEARLAALAAKKALQQKKYDSGKLLLEENRAAEKELRKNVMAEKEKRIMSEKAAKEEAEAGAKRRERASARMSRVSRRGWEDDSSQETKIIEVRDSLA